MAGTIIISHIAAPFPLEGGEKEKKKGKYLGRVTVLMFFVSVSGFGLVQEGRRGKPSCYSRCCFPRAPRGGGRKRKLRCRHLTYTNLFLPGREEREKRGKGRVYRDRRISIPAARKFEIEKRKGGGREDGGAGEFLPLPLRKKEEGKGL